MNWESGALIALISSDFKCVLSFRIAAEKRKSAAMKKILLALLVGMIMAPAALAGTIIISDGAGSPGGIFGVVTSGHGSFQTFCLENNEYLWDYGREFYYETSTGGHIPGCTWRL